MNKAYSRVNWSNDTSKKTFVNDTNLNIMDKGIDTLDNRIIGLDSRILELEGYEEEAKESAENADVSEANAKASENNAKVSENLAKEYMERALSTTPEGYNALVDKVDLLDIKTSESYTLPNSKQGGYRLLELQGNTEQKKLSGKQLYDVSQIPVDNNVKVDSDGFITVTCDNTSGTAVKWVSANVPPSSSIKEGGKYTVVVEIVTNNADSFQVSTNGADGFEGQFDSVFILRNKETGIHASVLTAKTDMSSAKTMLRTIIGTDAGKNVTVKFRLSVLEDTTVTAENFVYEPYCGGVPSPNPKYPQPMYHTSDVVEMESGAINSDGSMVNLTTRVRSGNYIPCHVGDNISIAYEKPTTLLACAFYNESGFVAYNRNNSGTLTNVFSVTAPSGATKFKFVVGEDVDITPDTVGKITLTINGKYVGCVKGHGKNFWYAEFSNNTSAIVFDKISQTYTLPTGTTGVILAEKTNCNLKKGTTVTLSVRVEKGAYTYSADGIYFGFYNKDKSAIGGVYIPKGVTYANNVYSKTIELADDVEYWRLYRDGSGSCNVTSEIKLKIQAEIGTEVTEWTPHKETVAHFLTNEPLRKRDVLFKDTDGLHKIEHNTTEWVLDGSADEAFGAWGTLYPNAFYCATSSLGMKKNANALCSHYSKVASSDLNSVDYGMSIETYLTIKDKDCSTVDELKSKLASNPITIEGEKATPTIEVLDTSSQIALNSLETFNGATYIVVDSRTMASGIKGEYGTSQVGAYTLQSLNNTESNAVRLNELAVAMVSLGSEV